MESADLFRALANERRLQILEWLCNPRAHFPPQKDGDLEADGVCSVFIANKLGVTQPTLSEHMRSLVQSGLVTAKRVRQWTFYKRDEARIREAVRTVADALSPSRGLQDGALRGDLADPPADASAGQGDG